MDVIAKLAEELKIRASQAEAAVKLIESTEIFGRGLERLDEIGYARYFRCICNLTWLY